MSVACTNGLGKIYSYFYRSGKKTSATTLTYCTVKDPALFTVVVMSHTRNRSVNLIKRHHFSSKLNVARLMSKALKPKTACGAKWMYISHQLLPHRRMSLWAWGEHANTNVPGSQNTGIWDLW